MIQNKLICVVLAAATASLVAQSADDVIRKNVEAHGGLEKIKAVKTVKLTGKAIFAGGQLEGPLVYRSKRPTRYRTEITIQGKTMTEAFDGSVKWISDGQTPQKSTDDSARTAADSADMIGSPLFSYRERGDRIELLGKEDSDSVSCYKFKVTLKSGNLATVYVDAKTFLTAKTVTKAGAELEAESKLGDYRRVEGVMIPFSNAIKINQAPVMRMQYDKAEVNIPMDDLLFVMPGVK